MKTVYRLPPCPAYDVPGMEAWLEELAREGLFLERDGFFAGVGAFVRDTPRRAKYRLEAALQSTSMWSDSGGEPDGEAVELHEQYGWEYAGKRGDFHIYRTFDPAAREPHTDPEVQALALRAVEKRRRSAAVSLLFWLVLYPLVWVRGGVLLTVLGLGTWFSLFTALLALWVLVGAWREVRFLGRMRKCLLEEEPIPQKSRRYRTGNLIFFLLVLLWVGLALHGWSVSIMEEDKLLLSDYHQTPPFATLADFAGPGAYDYQITWPDKSFSSVKAWTDPLAPQNLQWAEHGRVTRSDGAVIDGGLRIDYHETVHPLLAAAIAREYRRLSGRKAEPLDLPDLGVDFAAAYRDGSTHFPTVVLQQGNRVLRATFYQFRDSPLSLAEWSGILADSIRSAPRE